MNELHRFQNARCNDKNHTYIGVNKLRIHVSENITCVLNDYFCFCLFYWLYGITVCVLLTKRISIDAALAAVNVCPLLLLVHVPSHVWQQAQSPCRRRSLSRGCQQQYSCEQKDYTTRGEYTIVCYNGKRNSSRVMWKGSVKKTSVCDLIIEECQ